jgi:pyruvate/2-oxoglutarate/acetoin dehydrogenase E1 component
MRSITMSQAINEAIREEMRVQPEMILLGQDIGSYGGTFGVYRGLFDEFGPDRVRDGPLCESATVGFGIGLAMMGMRSVVELEFMDFATLALDQIVNQAAKMHYFYGGQVTVPMVVRTPIASRIGMGPQHSQSLEAWFMHVPGLRVVIPSNAYDAKGLMATALREPNPVVFIENVKLYNTKADVPEAPYAIGFGEARVLVYARDGLLQGPRRLHARLRLSQRTAGHECHRGRAYTHRGRCCPGIQTEAYESGHGVLLRGWRCV